MKILYLLFSSVFLPKNILSDNLLSKFHQNDYKIKNTRVEFKRCNEDLVNIYHARTFKYNRTVTAHNGTLNFNVDAADKMEVVVQVYKFLSNEYRHFPIRFQVNLCKAIEANVMGIQAFMKCGTFKECFFKKNVTYHVCNFVIDETCFPPLIPNGMFMAEMQLMYNNQELCIIDCFAEIYRPLNYRY